MSIDELMIAIAKDVVYNKTKMWEREDIVLATLLTYMSIERFMFKGRIIRGWLDTLIFGESKSGKSDTVRTMIEWAGRGAIVREKATYAGLAGGVNRNQYGNMARSGVFAANDHGLVLIDEMQNLAVEDIGRMTDIRSSGIAQIEAICKIMDPARCRKIWIANPRPRIREQMVKFNSAAYPIELVKELVGVYEDLTRFDLFLGFKSTTNETIKKYRNPDRALRILTGSKLRRLIDIAWSRQINNVEFTDEAIAACEQYSDTLNTKYAVDDFPFILGAEQEQRMARIGAAVAMLIRYGEPSIETLGKVVVRTEHIEWVYKWLTHLIEDNDLQYGAYARNVQRFTKQQYSNKETIVSKIRRIKNYGQVLFVFANSSYITEDELRREAAGVPNPSQVISGFYRAGLLKKQRGGYTKTPLFNELLNDDLAQEIDTDINNISFGEDEVLI